MFLSALFIISPNWKQPRSLPMDKWLNKLACPYHGKLSSHEKEQIIDTHTIIWMSFQRIPLRKKKERKKDRSINP